MSEAEQDIQRMGHQRSRTSSFRVWWNTYARSPRPSKDSGVRFTTAATRCQECIATDNKKCTDGAVKENIGPTTKAPAKPDRDNAAIPEEAEPSQLDQTEHQSDLESEDGIENWEELRDVIDAVRDTVPQGPSPEGGPAQLVQVPPVSVLNRKRGQNL
jgi:hypothetical protein